ncbi:MAG: hypothetical protein ACE5J4_01595 [Candidatus Aenigmatarchaeota archaeon]
MKWVNENIFFVILLTFLLVVSISFAEYGVSKIYFGAGECDAPPSSGDWNISEYDWCWFQDQTIRMNGSLTIYGTLLFENVTLLVNNTKRENNITVYSGGEFYIEDKSNITAYNKDYKFEFIVKDGSVFNMSNSFLSYAGTDSSNQGFEIFTDNVKLINNTISNNYVGIYLNGSSNNNFTDNVIRDCTYDFNLTDNSINNIVLNSSFNKSKVMILDTSNLTVKWFLDVYVTDGTNPIAGALVTITDNKSNTIFSGNTNTNGYIDTRKVIEMIMSSTGNDYYTPHLIEVSKSGYNPSSTTVNMSQSKLATITLTPVTPTEYRPTGVGGVPIQPVTLDTTVHIEPGSEQVTPGSRVYATITIQKAGGVGTVNVNLTYSIIDPDGNVVNWKTTTVGIETIRTDIYYLTLPPDVPFGTYIFRAKATYDTATDTSEDTFQVVKVAPLALIEVKDIEVPIMFQDVKAKIFITIDNLVQDPLTVNVTMYYPGDFEATKLSDVKIVEGLQEEIFEFSVTPRVFGFYSGYVSIKYDGRGITREFSIFVLPSLTKYLWWIILLIIIIIVIYLRRKEKRYVRETRIQRLRRLVRR